jgi:hypothetical protein
MGAFTGAEFHRRFQEGSMHRMIGFLVIIWLATSAAVQAQTVSQGTFSQGTIQNGTTLGAVTSTTSTLSSTTSSAFGSTTVNGTSLPGTSCSFTGSLSIGLGCETGSSGVASSNTSTSPTSAPAGGSAAIGAGSAGGASGISASASVNPQTAVQLPGETPNTSTQGANTTAATATGLGASSRMPCSPTISSVTGTGSSVGELFGAGSLGGC